MKKASNTTISSSTTTTTSNETPKNNAFSMLMKNASTQSKSSSTKKRKVNLNGTTSTTTSKSTLGKEFCNEYDLDKDGFMMFEPTGISKAAQNTNTNTTNQKEDEDGGGEEEFDLDQHRKQHKSALLSKTVTARFHMEHTNEGKFRCSWLFNEEGKPNPIQTHYVYQDPHRLRNFDGHSDAEVLVTTNYSSLPIDWTQPDVRLNYPNANNTTCNLSPANLKSALQKNVRLMRVTPALRVALHLMRLDFSQFVRRLAIIVLEDGILHPDLPFLCWLMMACSTPHFVCSGALVDECLRIVFEISSCKIRDPYELLDSSLKGKTAPTVSQILSLGVEKEQNLIFSILTRATFGGMKGDVVMLRKYAQVWFERFSGISKPPDHNENKFGWISYLEENCYNFNKTTTTRYSYKAISPLSFDDIPLSAIDFHCSNIIDDSLLDRTFKQKATDWLQAYFGEKVDIPKKLSSLMWNCRSSLNNREIMFSMTIPKSDEEKTLDGFWKEAQPVFDKYSTIFIKKRFI